MKELKHQSYLIQELNKLLFECKEKNKNIGLVWVPIHNGIKSNDKADELAKKVVVEDPLFEVEVSHSDLIYIFRNKCVKDNDNSLNHRACISNKGAILSTISFYHRNLTSSTAF